MPSIAVFIGVVATLLEIGRWVLLIGFCVLLYRRLRLPTLPWLATYFALVFLNRFTGPIVSEIFKRTWTLAQPADDAAAIANLTATVELTHSTISLLVAAMVLSEIAYVFSLHFPNVRSHLLTGLGRVRDHATALGVVLLVLSLAPSMSLLVTWAYYRAAHGA